MIKPSGNHAWICFGCRKARGKLYYRANKHLWILVGEAKAARKVNQAAYYRAHRQYYLNRAIERRAQNREAFLAYSRAYDAAHLEAKKLRCKEWSKQHSSANVAMVSRRRTRLAGNGGSFTGQEWDALKARYNYTCLCCNKTEPDIKLTADHVIPVIKGGTSFINNIQPLCRVCNSRKRDKDTDYRYGENSTNPDTNLVEAAIPVS